MRIENIEIGAGPFRRLIDSADPPGISIEPVKHWFDQLPDRDGWTSLCAAVSDKPGEVTLYYTDPDKITNQPKWVHGCNRIGSPHPTIKKNWPELIAPGKVKVITPRQLCDEHNITEVGFLKIDTEGHDCKIINAWIAGGCPLPDKLQFESNSLTDRDEYLGVVDVLLRKGYAVRRGKTDTICTK